jgi:Domain of unknown function (DUF4307)
MTSIRNRVAYAVIGVFVAVCAIGWAIIMTHADGTPGVAPEIVSWRASDHSVLVRFQIGKPKGQRVRCAIVAYDPRHGEVGRAEVAMPPGSAVIAERREVPTSARATAVEVKECRKDG